MEGIEMVICFSGWKGSGKDSIANYLIKNHKAVRVALADPLKDSVAKEFGIDRSSLDDPKRKESPLLDMPVKPRDAFSRMISRFMFKEFRAENGKQPNDFSILSGKMFGIFDYEKTLDKHPLYWTPRALAILKGSVNRSVRSDFWTNKAFEAIQNKLDDNRARIVVVTDVRYKSELTQFKTRFKDGVVFVRVNRFKDSPSTDPSERDLDDTEFDFYIDNTGTLDQAFEQMEEILARL